MKKLFSTALTSLLVFTSVGSHLAYAQSFEVEWSGERQAKSEQVPRPVTYSEVMREFHDAHGSKDLAKVENAILRFETFISAEKARGNAITSKQDKLDKYFSRLSSQKAILEEYARILDGTEGEPKLQNFKTEPKIEVPDNPSAFAFDYSPIEFQEMGVQAIEPVNPGFQNINLDADDLPIIEDLQEDPFQVDIDPAIKSLAVELDSNPLKIVNFVKDTIHYEPYFGSKKGALGCLEENYCNDTDASSLTIALLRAAGVPARYRKSIAVMPTETLRNIVGVDHNNAAFAAIHWGGVPIFTEEGSGFDGDQFNEVDLSGEENFLVEWTHVQAFVNYDERRGDYSQPEDLSEAVDTNELRTIAQKYPQAQWIPIDTILKKYQRDQRPILIDQNNFDVEDFWYDFLQYQGEMTPVEKYVADIEADTGEVFDDNLSSHQSAYEDYPYLPVALPYQMGSGENEDIQIPIETWSELPEIRKQKVRVTLLDENDNPVFKHTFEGSVINNRSLEISYEGATPEDQQVIEDHGGISQTPAELVDIVPVGYLELEGGYQGLEEGGQPNLTIGDKLVTRVELLLRDEVEYTSEKFSVAGNNEGVFVILSRVQNDTYLDSPEATVFEGNAAIAHSYLKHLQESGDRLSKSLDLGYKFRMARAVVTQNRVLNEVNGTPTTFTFKGLTIDATTLISDYSRRGEYSNNRRNFNLIWGLEASDYEAGVLEDTTSLESISTVNGLQYVYDNPGDYDVHIITAANQNIIDGLDLSANTKQNMRDAIADGDTVITPDTYVEKGTWRGILYITLKEDGTGTYAIGEQVQNGAWQVATLQVEPGCPPGDNVCISRYYVSRNDRVFSFLDGYDGVTCSISGIDSTQIILNQDADDGNRPVYDQWAQDYGQPCYSELKAYGHIAHYFVISDFGARFRAQNTLTGETLYSYWVPRYVVRNKMTDAGVTFDKFKFNLAAGTYSNYNADSETASYYQPVEPVQTGSNIWNDLGTTRHVSGDILEIYDSPKYKPEHFVCPVGDAACTTAGQNANKVVDLIGYPTIDRAGAATSYPYDTEGEYQAFVGGDIYTEFEYFNETFYVPGMIAREFNDDANCQAGHGCGTGGVYGFPNDQPFYNPAQDLVFQDFESGKRIVEYLTRPLNANNRIEVRDMNSSVPIIHNLSSEELRPLVVEGMMDGLKERIWDFPVEYAAGILIEAVFKKLKVHAVNKLGKQAAAKLAAKFVPGVGWAITAFTSAVIIANNFETFGACNIDLLEADAEDLETLEGMHPAYYCGKLGVSIAMDTIGIGAGIVTNKKLNIFGTKTPFAKAGKEKISLRVNSQQDFENYHSALKNADIDQKDYFFKKMNNLSNGDIDALLDNPQLMKRISTGELSMSKTFDDLTVFEGNVRPTYKVDSEYTHQFDLYDDVDAFGFQELKEHFNVDGLFYGKNQLDDALAAIDPGNSNQYVMYVLEPDGGLVFFPREDNLIIDGELVQLPHPFLSDGGNVLMAGEIRFRPGGGNNSLNITRKSGHFKPGYDDLTSLMNSALSGTNFDLQFPNEY